MTPSDFNSCMSALGDYYGDKAFPPRSKDILFRILIGLAKNDLLRVIDLVAEEHARAPTIAAIKKTALPFLRDAEARRTRIEIERLEGTKEARCRRCDFTGYVLALSKTDVTIEFSFRCPSCPAARARRIDSRIPEWSHELNANYIPVGFQLESHESARKVQRQANVAKVFKRGGKLAPVNAELQSLAASVASQLIKTGGLDVDVDAN